MITVDNLRFTYPNAPEESIKGISFSIDKGEIFGFLGPSGSGKSTTQKILNKLLDGYAGSAVISGTEVRNWGRDLYHSIGVGFELPNHYLKLTALENLRFFRSFYNRGYRPEELLEMVGLKDAANKKVSEFSKGMKMRLNFIRAWMHDPEILFLDEPASGLDPYNARIVKDIIRDLQSRGKTIFITTHQMYDADELCDRVAFISEGEIRAMDTPARLKQTYSRKTVEVTFAEERSPEIFALDTLGTDARFLEVIRRQKVAAIHSQEATLDEVFIRITGKSLHA